MTIGDALPGTGQAAARSGSRQAPLSVTQVVKRSTRALEQAFGTLYVAGEVVSCVRAASGHYYFSLSDGQSQIRCVMWRSSAARLRFRLEDGVAAVCRGQLGIYERDGKFQLYVAHAEPVGLGADALALAQLKKKLAGEGLFDSERKRPLPHIPGRIGVVTSKSGAAVRDIVRAVQRRFPIPILIADARVQGKSAPASIVAALTAIGATDVDVVIVGRGGGSSSDLSAFDDESVVRAVVACPVPVISAVGHEVDISLTDLAADVRAATPTMAGEMAVPVIEDLLEQLAIERRRLDREISIFLRSARNDVDRLADFASAASSRRLSQARHQLGELSRALLRCHPRAALVADRAQLRELQAQLRLTVISRIAGARVDLEHLDDRMHDLAGGRVRDSQHHLATLVAKMDALSPLKVLKRGYAIASTGERVITDAAVVRRGDPVQVKLARGALDCVVEGVRDVG